MTATGGARGGSSWSSPSKRDEEAYQKTLDALFGTGPKNAAKTSESDAAVAEPATRETGAEETSGKAPVVAAVAAGSLLLVVLIAGVSWVLPRVLGGEGEPPTTRAPAVGTAEVGPKPTGVVFPKPKEGEGGSYDLTVGEYTWSGRKTASEDGEEVVLEGRTAAHFTRAVALRDGSITTGVFGRAEPDGLVWHATFQRTALGDGQHTAGTYQVVDGGRLLLEGEYADRLVEDRSGGEPDVYVRTYSEGPPDEPPEERRRYTARFEAAPGVPIPWLPGWQPPKTIPDGKEGQR